MNEVNWLHIFVEAAVIIVAVVGAHWRGKVQAEHRFTKLEVLVKGLSTDHVNLDNKVSGISKRLYELSAHMKAKGNSK